MDCGTQLRRANTGYRCAECRLVRRNEQLSTPAMRERQQQLLRAAAVAQRIAEIAETSTNGGKYG